MNEIWKNIENYEGLYQVSNLGRVKSLDRIDNIGRKRKGRILKAQQINSGYLQVPLWKNNKVELKRVHRLVAEAFLDNPDNLPEVNHKNEIKTDNRVENLEFCDSFYNARYETALERRRKANTNHPSYSKKVYQYSLDGELIAEYPSTMEVQRQLAFTHTNISKCCLGKCDTRYGYKWSYIKK